MLPSVKDLMEVVGWTAITCFRLYSKAKRKALQPIELRDRYAKDAALRCFHKDKLRTVMPQNPRTLEELSQGASLAEQSISANTIRSL